MLVDAVALVLTSKRCCCAHADDDSVHNFLSTSAHYFFLDFKHSAHRTLAFIIVKIKHRETINTKCSRRFLCDRDVLEVKNILHNFGVFNSPSMWDQKCSESLPSSVCVPVCLCVTNSSTLISRSIFPFNLRLLISFVTVRSPTSCFKDIDARSMFRQVEHFANYAIPTFSLPFCFGEN